MFRTSKIVSGALMKSRNASGTRRWPAVIISSAEARVGPRASNALAVPQRTPAPGFPRPGALLRGSLEHRCLINTGKRVRFTPPLFCFITARVAPAACAPKGQSRFTPHGYQACAPFGKPSRRVDGKHGNAALFSIVPHDAGRTDGEVCAVVSASWPDDTQPVGTSSSGGGLRNEHVGD